ncbi:Sporulation-specific N-acetylmuramoyl-L-alanine amidase [compost metagenome]
MKIVVLDAGHGGIDSGAVGNGLKEKDLTLEMVKMIGKGLVDNYSEVKVIYTRQTDVFIKLDDRSDIANKNNADLFVSVHINAAGDELANGMEAFYFKDSKATIITYNHIMNEIEKSAYKVNNRGTKIGNLSVLRNTKCPAVLTETLFITNKANSILLKNQKFINDVCLGHIRGIATFLNLKENKLVNSPSPAPSIPQKSEPANWLKSGGEYLINDLGLDKNYWTWDRPIRAGELGAVLAKHEAHLRELIKNAKQD